MIGSSSPKVSVTMPVYNGESHLEEALDSLLAQSFSDFEIVAVDDGSTDSSWAILSSYADRDRRVRPVRHETNRGHHAASNTAIGDARGEYIARHDQDDVALPERLAAAVELLDRSPDVGLVHSAYLRWLPDGTLLPRVPPSSHTALRIALLFGNVICHASVTVRASVLRGLGECYRELGGPQDYDLWIRLADRTTTAGLLDPLVAYRQSSMAMTKKFEGEIDGVVADLSDEQLQSLVPSVDGDAVRRLYRFEWGSGLDGAAVVSLHAVLDAASQSLPNVDPSEVQSLESRWTRRALRTCFSGQWSRPRAPSLLWEIVRSDPKEAMGWSRDEGTRRLRSLRSRVGGVIGDAAGAASSAEIRDER